MEDQMRTCPVSRCTLLVVVVGFIIIWKIDKNARSNQEASSKQTTKDKMTPTTTIFLKQGNRFKVSSQAALDSLTTLPVGTYTVGVEMPMGELFLQPIDDFRIPGKLYSNTMLQAGRILRTFADRPAATGVLLTAEKGSGKTLLAKVVARKAAVESKILTIVVNQNLHGESSNGFLQAIRREGARGAWLTTTIWPHIKLPNLLHEKSEKE
eukprot:scaffold3785_cov165-Amphora_coffeaeformis.AAC.3